MEDTNDLPQRKSIRLKDYDYSKAGYYFITLCSKDREYLFGNCKNHKCNLNESGKILEENLKALHEKYPHCEIDYYCIMPNHIHFILIIGNCRCDVSSPIHSKDSSIDQVTKLSPAPKLGNIIAFYKYQTTKNINEMRKFIGVPVWQRNYYEHIIRNDKELFEIRKYIENNPLSWSEDEYYKIEL